MKRSLIFVVYLLFLGDIHGQIQNKYDYFLRKTQIAGSNESKIVINKNNGDTTFQAYYNSRDVVNNTHQEFTKTYKGTPFFKNGWYKGKVNTEGGKGIEFLMAFNVQKNEVYLVENAEKEAITIKPQQFTIAGHTFNQLNRVFFETIYDNKSTILKEHSCTLSANGVAEKTGYETSGGVGEYEGEFVKSSKYFLLTNNELKPLTRGKQLLKVFGSKKTQVEAFAKTNKINLKSENGIVSAFKYYDSL